MKKTLLALLSVVIISATMSGVYAKVAKTNSETASAIKLYKAGNYSQAYISFKNITLKDPGNALATYYLAMSAVRVGQRDEAIQNYEKVMVMSPNGVLGSYAKKGKKCVEEPDKCGKPDAAEAEETAEDAFIRGAFGSGFSNQARGTHEKEKIENMKREINRNQYIPAEKFREYKDFSTQAPTNDEIVAAIRVLQAAGLSDLYNGYKNGSELSYFLGSQNNTNTANNDMLNLLFMNKNGTSNLNPQVIQSLLSTQMTTSF